MIIPNSIRQKYDEVYPLYFKLQDRVNENLTIYCSDNNYTFTYRIKTLKSLSEKIESGRYENWKSIDDIYATTIIIPTLTTEKIVIDDMKKYFNIIEMKIRGGANKAPDTFRFDSTRLICKLKSFGIHYPINALIFEIQIKSAFEFAWSITTHSLTYKTNRPSWERLRLTSHIKAVVEQIDILLLGFEQSSKLINKSNFDRVEIISKLCNFVESLENNIQSFPAELNPNDLNRFSENIFSMIKKSKWYYTRKRKYDDITIFNQIIDIINSELIELEYFPRSISLHQLFLGILIEKNILADDFKRYTPLITEELKNLFPKSKAIITYFEFN